MYITNNQEINNIIANRRQSYIKQIIYILIGISVFYSFIWFNLNITKLLFFCIGNLFFTLFLLYLNGIKIKKNNLINLIIFQCTVYIFFTSIWLYDSTPVILGYYFLLPLGALLLNNFKLSKIVGIICTVLIFIVPQYSTKYSTPLPIEYSKTLTFAQIVTILTILMILLYSLSNYYKILLSNLEERAEQLEKTQQYKNRFFASISHELRTPMNAIKGISSLLLSNSTLLEEEKELVYNLNNSSIHLLSLINDLLDLSKIEEKKIVLHQTNMDINATITKAIEIVRHAANQKNLTIEYYIEPTIPKIIWGDSIRIMQIILNLLSNAIKFTEKGGIKISCKKIITLSEQFLQIDVEDTGIGISNDCRNEIFKSYYQAQGKNSQIQVGTGLGLSISKSLVKLMKGTINFKSEYKKGTTFYFTIPLLEGNEKAFLSSNPIFEINQKQTTKLKILVLDDNQLNILVLKKILIKHLQNAIIITSENGLEAIEKLKIDNDFDIILLDLQMPIIDGFEVTKIIRSSTNTHVQNIPIIALSANISFDIEEKCKQFGMQDFLGKPFEVENLIEKINKYVA